MSNNEQILFYIENFKLPFKKGDLVNLEGRSAPKTYDRFFVFEAEKDFPRLEVCENSLKNWFLAEWGRLSWEAGNRFKSFAIGEKGIFTGQYICFLQGNNTKRGIKHLPILGEDWQNLSMNAKELAKGFFEPNMKMWLKCFSLRDYKSFWVSFITLDEALDTFWTNQLLDYKIKYPGILNLQETVFPECVDKFKRK